LNSNIGGRYYRASLIIVKFEFVYRPIFKRLNVGGRYIGRSRLEIVDILHELRSFEMP